MSSGDDALSFLYMVGLLALVGSAFLAHRLPLGRSLKMAAAWVLIFGAVFLAFTLRDDFRALGRRVVAETAGSAQGEGGELRIRKAEDGHFWVDASLNGRPVRFLVDSGATVTAISPETAQRVGIEAAGGLPVVVSTANGVVRAERARAERIVVGSIARDDLAVHIAPGLGDTDLLGMNFLSTLSAWRIEGEWLVLRP